MRTPTFFLVQSSKNYQIKLLFISQTNVLQQLLIITLSKMEQIQGIISWIKQRAFPDGNHRFFIDSSPSYIQSNTLITIKCYNNQNKQRIVSCRFSWSRIFDTLITPLGYIKGNTYQCSPDDVGSVISVEITSLDSEYPGSTTLTFGPVRIEISLRNQLQKLINKKQGKFPVLVSSLTEEKEIQIRMNEKYLQFKSLAKEGEEFRYSLIRDIIEIKINNKDLTKLSIKFSQQLYQQSLKFFSSLFQQSSSIKIYKGTYLKLDLQFSSINLRNQFLFLHKIFLCKKQCQTLAILSKFQHLSVTHNQIFDYMLQIGYLKEEIIRSAEVNTEMSKEKEFYGGEIRRLEEEMELIIVTYTKIVEEKYANQLDLNNSYSILSQKRDQVVNERTMRLEEINKQYSMKILNLTEELRRGGKDKRDKERSVENGKMKNSLGVIKKQAPFEEIECRLHELSEINVKLTKQNEKLKLMNKSQNRRSYVSNHSNILDELREQDEFIFQRKQSQNEQTIKQKQQKDSTSKPPINKISNYNDILHSQFKNKSALQISKEYIQLQSNFKKLKQQNRKLTQLRQYDKINFQLQISRTKLQASKLQNQQSKLQFHNKITPNHQVENKQLRVQISALKHQIQSITNEHTKLLEKYRNLQNEYQLLKQGQDILNKSRDFSMEMDNYYSQENDVVKEQNKMLVEENERLAKMCERYLGDAKEGSKLRGEIVELRKEVTKLKVELDQRETKVMNE